MNKKIILWIFVIMIMAASADALGMIPAKTSVQFLNESRTYEITIVNNDHTDMELSVYPSGELAPFIEVLDSEVVMSNEEDYRKVRFKVNPLGDLLSPGIKEGVIVIEEGISKVKISSNGISARLKLNHKIFLEVPYPEKYIESDISIDDLGSDLEIKNKLKNRGSKAVNDLAITYEIKDGAKSVDKIEENIGRILSKDEKEIRSYLGKEKVSYGEYELKAVMKYEGNSLELNRIFNVGKPDLDIRSYNRYLISNKINEFDIDLENRWNKMLKGVYFETELFKEERKIYSSKSISFDIPAKGSKRVTSYIDTRDMEDGEYKGSITMHLEGREITKDIDIDLISEEEYAKTDNKSSFGLWIALINILLLAGFMVYYFRRKRKED